MSVLRYTRRSFVKGGALALVAMGAAPRFVVRTALAQSRAARSKVLVVVFQRGAVDGLSMLVPHGDADYYGARGSIAIARPSAQESAIDLDGFFGLHPALAPLKPLWDERRLAPVHACGSPDTTRSHFDAQDYMESGTPGVKSTPDGWLARGLAAMPEPDASPFRAVALGPALPRVLRGDVGAVAMSNLAEFDEQVAQGLYLPSSNLRRALQEQDFDSHEFNFRQAERAWNRGQSQQETKEVKEAYVDVEVLDSRLWMRFGLQNIVWGKTELFRTSDILTCHAPLTSQTRHIVNRERLATMKPTAILINTSRGPVVDEPALIEALQQKRIAGAGVDVFEKEPVDPANPLLRLENVVLSPHSAGTTWDTWFRRADFAYKNMKRVWDGQPPQSVATDYDAENP